MKQDKVLITAIKPQIKELVDKLTLTDFNDIEEQIKELQDQGNFTKPDEFKELVDELQRQNKIDQAQYRELLDPPTP